MQKSNGVAAVDRAIDILSAIAQADEPLSLAELSRATGYYKSTLLRLMASLERASLIVRLTNARYMIGPYAGELGRRYELTHQLHKVIAPLFHDLVAKGSESPSFHVYFDATHRLCVLRINSHHSTLDRVAEGDHLPLDRGAAGKVIMAFHNTGRTPTPDNVVAVSLGERDPVCAAVACAVFTKHDEFCGAMSLSGPKERFTAESIKRMTDMVRRAAKEASRALGGSWPEK